MRFVFHNPHTLWFKNSSRTFFAHKKSVNKYDYLFDYIYSHDKRIFVYLDNSSENPVFRGILKFANSPVLEFFTWVLFNKLNPFKFKLIANYRKLMPTDILFTFLYEHFTNQYATFSTDREIIVNRFKEIRAFKVVHLSHYGYNASIGSANTKNAGVDLFLSESNLYKNSEFFQMFYSWYKKDVYVLPFIPGCRFLKTTSFSNRKNKALATGSITHPMTDSDFINFFHNDKLQPVRHEIYNNVNNLSSYIDSIISDIRDIGSTTQVPNKVTLLLPSKFKQVKIVKALNLIRLDVNVLLKLLDFYFNKNYFSIKNERNYYKIDIVEKYNEYRMFIVPEEVINLPAIGFVEGMACGCAYIGINDPMYTEIGLVDRKNYIAYDGTLKDLCVKIDYYQRNEQELIDIAENGYAWVKEQCNPEIIMSKFLDYLEKTSLDRVKSENN